MTTPVNRAELAATIASRKLPPEHHARLQYFLDFLDKANGIVPNPHTVPTRLNPPEPDAPNTLVPTAGWQRKT